MIPLSLLSKMSNYELEVHGLNMQASVLDNHVLVDEVRVKWVYEGSDPIDVVVCLFFDCQQLTGFCLFFLKMKLFSLKKKRHDHYRSISLCNVANKIIFKILANLLKSFLFRLISPMQSAFVQGRVIQENSILTHEVFHLLKNKWHGRNYMTIRADIEKAYDGMEWNIIVCVLQCFGFHPIF